MPRSGRLPARMLPTRRCARCCTLFASRGQGFGSTLRHPGQRPVPSQGRAAFAVRTAAECSNPSHRASCPTAEGRFGSWLWAPRCRPPSSSRSGCAAGSAWPLGDARRTRPAARRRCDGKWPRWPSMWVHRLITEGKTRKEALRALKRRISDAIYARVRADARQAPAAAGPGGQAGNDSDSSAADSHPQAPALRKGHSRARHQPTGRRPAQQPRAATACLRKSPADPLTAKRSRSWRQAADRRSSARAQPIWSM